MSAEGANPGRSPVPPTRDRSGLRTGETRHDPPQSARSIRETALQAPRLPATDSARLVAIEMAVAGSTRGEVALRLRTEFGVQRPDPFLDDVFGSGTGPETRMPWSAG